MDEILQQRNQQQKQIIIMVTEAYVLKQKKNHLANNAKLIEHREAKQTNMRSVLQN
jgi:6-phosphofructokinase